MHWIALRTQPEKALPTKPGRGDAGRGDDLPADLPDALAALGWWALQFTPRVALLDDALLLEVSASERLWGGRKSLLHQIFESNKPVASVQYARGATSLIAIGRLHEARLARTQPDDLPLAALAAARPHLATLARIGCTHWGQLRALPRGGVARRFGAALLDALDCAYGQKPELYPWLVMPDVFEATLELGAQVETAPALLFGARRLLSQLQVWLQLRQAGALALVLRWTMDPRRNTATQGELVLRSAEPTGNMAHLQRLLAEQLAHVRLSAPVQYLHLRTLETQKLGGETGSLLPDEQRPGDSLQCLLERLSARLGPENVLQMQADADYRPERMQRWNAAKNATQLIAACASSTVSRGQNDSKNMKMDALYPTWLLASPVKLALHRNSPQDPGPLTLLAGPQRLEAGWWVASDCGLRDYFLARSERMGLLWVYRERLGGQGAQPATDPDWYLHGLFA